MLMLSMESLIQGLGMAIFHELSYTLALFFSSLGNSFEIWRLVRTLNSGSL
jgi:hypothetical protein